MYINMYSRLHHFMIHGSLTPEIFLSTFFHLMSPNSDAIDTARFKTFEWWLKNVDFHVFGSWSRFVSSKYYGWWSQVRTRLLVRNPLGYTLTRKTWLLAYNFRDLLKISRWWAISFTNRGIWVYDSQAIFSRKSANSVFFVKHMAALFET